MRRRAQNRAEIERAKLRGGRAAQAQHPRGVRTVRRKTNGLRRAW